MAEASADCTAIFSAIYEQDHWSNGSGPGSRPYFTIEYRGFLEKFVGMNTITSIVDIGCGDWQFSRLIHFGSVRYYGFDVVPALIEANCLRFGCSNVSFHLLPSDPSQLPKADLLIMKDVLQHWPDCAINFYKSAVFPRFRFCLLTNSYQKLHTPHNVDIPFGNFRTLDLTAKPYLINGSYLFEHWGSEPWERIRTLLVRCQLEGPVGSTA
ncbi:MAG: class I SAM-dependent methyltransferase [Acidisphaera sp.]|nr:class I SAM-dependent methyltransferase [Acidisphaera sp.]